MASSSAVSAGGHSYTICPSSSDVCRIRFDFTAFTLAPPTLEATETAALGTNGGSLGDCVEDNFSITSANGGSPVICGENTGQHMILDSDGTSCSQVNFGIGSGAVTRQWDIMVTQYKCGEEAGGPSGCLQWHMTATGCIRSFGFPDLANDAAIPDTSKQRKMVKLCILQQVRIWYNNFVISQNTNFHFSFSSKQPGI
jgi:hypothetical protein